MSGSEARGGDSPASPEVFAPVTVSRPLPLFVYGSLRDPAIRRRLLGRRGDFTTRPARLEGYARQAVAGFGYPFIVPSGPEACVEGELLEGLGQREYAILDAYEDVEDGLYLRVRVTVQTPDGPVDAWVYVRGPHAP